MFNEKDKAIRLLQNGLRENDNVRTAVLFLSKFYKYLGHDKEHSVEEIRRWINSQNLTENNMTYTQTIDDLNDYVEDALNKIPNNIFKKDYKFIDNINVSITLAEMECINGLKSKGDKLVAFALVYMSKIFKDENSYFYCRHNLLHKLTGISRVQIKAIIKRLEDNGFIDAIRDEKGYCSIKRHDGFGKRYSKPNMYSVNVKPNNVNVVNIPDTDSILPYFVDALYTCMINYDFKLTVRLKEFVLREKCKK